MPSPEERFATLEADSRNTAKAIDAIFDYMREGRQWRDDTTRCLATLVTNHQRTAEYQVRCDNERDSIDKTVTLLGTRMDNVEAFHKRQIKVAVWAGGIAGSVILGGSKAFDKLDKFLGLFS
jgi:hypothetical protein